MAYTIWWNNTLGKPNKCMYCGNTDIGIGHIVCEDCVRKGKGLYLLFRPYFPPKDYKFCNDCKKKTILNKWNFDPTRKVFVNVEKFVTYEQYENHRGKYQRPTDELLNTIWMLINLE